MVLIEALARRLPCVSFDCKEGPAEIIDDGVNGFLVEPLNVQMLAEKMMVLMRDASLRETFSQQSAKDLARFDVDTVVGQWERLIESLVGA